MGQGGETKTRTEPVIEIQERGEIFMFYRPKVEKEEAHGAEDVQRLYLVLRPESGEREVEEKQQDPQCGGGGGGGNEQINIEKQPALLRFIVMGRKSLPDPSKKSTPCWGFVEMVTTNIEDVKDALKGEEYETATRGRRHKPDSRAVGEGIYRILRHIINPAAGSSSSRMHTHLVYKLEYPVPPQLGSTDQGRHHEDGGEQEQGPQEALNIAPQASFLLQKKNPDQQHGVGFRGLQSKRKASFPAHMQGLFGRNRYHPADPPDFLNYEGCEFLLISASDDIEDELGLELRTEQSSCETAAECSDLIKTFGESTSASPATRRPLLQGTWV
ncbi:hypothetical protein BUALT_Bualt07G0177400 [Buddleja alternifolia]|uniref:Uncharacterized protein n=1 Tax=Buddleja alternifolia TaxID=168488 RepID=A0AAV6XFX7_9LAMI|nr:hypothetical protein BUALT_Bualt07G0177400 [Buddleja alternifolia]